MIASTGFQKTKKFEISDEGDAFELALIDEGQQVVGAYFPIALGEDRAFDLAKRIGESFLGN